VDNTNQRFEQLSPDKKKVQIKSYWTRTNSRQIAHQMRAHMSFFVFFNHFLKKTTVTNLYLCILKRNLIKSTEVTWTSNLKIENGHVFTSVFFV